VGGEVFDGEEAVETGEVENGDARVEQVSLGFELGAEEVLICHTHIIVNHSGSESQHALHHVDRNLDKSLHGSYPHHGHIWNEKLPLREGLLVEVNHV